jgi:hypothetical protein
LTIAQLDLAEAEDHHLLAELFAVLDGKGIPAALGTILAKLRRMLPAGRRAG